MPPRKKDARWLSIGRKAIAVGFTATSVAGALLAMLLYFAVLWPIGQLHSELGRAKQERRDRLVEVPVAARTIGVGEDLALTDFMMISMDRDYLPVDVLLHIESFEGRIVQERILRGDLLREERLAPPGASGLAALLPEGTRALSVALSSEWSVEGLVTPGASIDLLWTISGSETRAGETVTLVEAAYVLAVGLQISADIDGEPIVRPKLTLALSPTDAERVTHASGLGPFAVALRSEMDIPTPLARTAAPIGTLDRRMSAREFFDKVSPEEIEQMTLALGSPEKRAEPKSVVKVMPFFVKR